MWNGPEGGDPLGRDIDAEHGALHWLASQRSWRDVGVCFGLSRCARGTLARDKCDLGKTLMDEGSQKMKPGEKTRRAERQVT